MFCLPLRFEQVLSSSGQLMMRDKQRGRLHHHVADLAVSTDAALLPNVDIIVADGEIRVVKRVRRQQFAQRLVPNDDPERVAVDG